jgi:hypothetical protein
MAYLTWDKPGERYYQTGVDRGVLFRPNHGGGVVWNGLTGVDESSDMEITPYYLDGVKYLQVFTPGDFSAKVKAFTYPEDLDIIMGIASFDPGFAYYDQPAKSFSMSYRTHVGSDLDGPEHKYKIHILYNVFANPDSVTVNTVKDSPDPTEFSWTLTGTPPQLAGYRPTVHISIDSEKTPPDVLSILEAQLYGTAVSNSSLPDLQDIAEYFGYKGALIIVDHHDGTWSAIDESDTYVTLLNWYTFQIDGADTTTIDADTYTISSTNVD